MVNIYSSQAILRERLQTVIKRNPRSLTLIGKDIGIGAGTLKKFMADANHGHERLTTLVYIERFIEREDAKFASENK